MYNQIENKTNMLVLNAGSANRIWRDAFRFLKTQGAGCVRPSRAGKTIEVLHCAVELQDPRQRWVSVRQPTMNVAFAIVEVVGIVNGRQDAGYLNYFNHTLPRFAGSGENYHGAYGYRLRRAFGVDQLQRAFDVLSHDKTSRQVVLQIWNSEIDMPGKRGEPRADDIPCNITSMLKVRDGRLFWMQTMRSNDLFRGFPYNIVQFTMLQEILAGWLNLDIGTYCHCVDSLHLYLEDLKSGVGLARRSSSKDTDSISIPKRDSERQWLLMNERINDLISSRQSDQSLRNMCRLPSQGLQNLMTIVVAEAARRQRNDRFAHEIAQTCTNTEIRTLWQRWARERKPSLPTK